MANDRKTVTAQTLVAHLMDVVHILNAVNPRPRNLAIALTHIETAMLWLNAPLPAPSAGSTTQTDQFAVYARAIAKGEATE